MSRIWLMKSEPVDREPGVKFSIEDFEKVKTTSWEGVRNPEASALMRDKMSVGDRVIFYHSNCKIPGAVGLATVSKAGYPDHNAWDPKHRYYDPKSDPKRPKWYMVDLTFTRRLTNPVTLASLKYIASRPPSNPDHLATLPPYIASSPSLMEAIRDMKLFQRSRLSVQPVEEKAYEAILLLSENEGKGPWNPPANWTATRAIIRKETASEKDGTRSESVESEGSASGSGSGRMTRGAAAKRKAMESEEGEGGGGTSGRKGAKVRKSTHDSRFMSVLFEK